MAKSKTGLLRFMGYDNLWGFVLIVLIFFYKSRLGFIPIIVHPEFGPLENYRA